MVFTKILYDFTQSWLAGNLTQACIMPKSDTSPRRSVVNLVLVWCVVIIRLLGKHGAHLQSLATHKLYNVSHITLFGRNCILSGGLLDSVIANDFHRL